MALVEEFLKHFKNEDSVQVKLSLFELDFDDKMDIMRHAVVTSDVKLLRYLYKKDFDFNRKYRGDDTFLHIAVRHNSLTSVKMLLSFHVSVTNENAEGKTPLQVAVEDGNIKIVGLLLRYDSRISVTDAQGDTVFHTATARGDMEMIKFLFTVGLGPLEKNKKGKTGFECAVESGNVDVVKLFINHVALRINKLLPFHWIAKYDQYNMVEVFLEAGYEIDTKDSNGRTAMHEAAERGSLNTMMCLEAGRAKLDAADNDGLTPLHVASIHGHLHVVEFLCDRGVTVKQSNTKKTALDYAVRREHANVVEFLVKNASGLERISRLPLHAAAKRGSVDVMRILLDAGWSHRRLDHNGNTCLHVALMENRTDVACSLIERRACFYAKNYLKKTPMHIAVEKENYEAVAMIIRHNPGEVHALGFMKQTPLHIAADKECYDMARLLLNHGAEVDAEDKNKETPLVCACETSSSRVAKLLLEHGANVNHASAYDITPMLHALHNHDTKLMRILIDAGAEIRNSYGLLKAAFRDDDAKLFDRLFSLGVDVNVRNRSGRTLLWEVARNGDVEWTRKLLDRGALVYADEPEDTSPFKVASLNVMNLMENARMRELTLFSHALTTLKTNHLAKRARTK